MSDALEVALRELQHTFEGASAYVSAENRHPEILRSHAADLAEDIIAVTQLKSNFGERAREILELVAEARRVKRLADKEAYSLEVEAKKQQPPTLPEPTPAAPVRVSGVKLPRIKLPMFDGESSDDFRGFIQAFNETVKAEPDLSSIRKWLLLKGQLSGKALQMVKELPLTPETFEAGHKILDDAYGSSRRSVLKMYQRLQTLPNAELETESLKLTYARLEGILLSLTNLAVDTNTNDFLRAVVISKFPHDLLHLLKVTDSMTLDEFRRTLNQYIQARDCAIQQVTTVPTSNTTNSSAKTNSFNGSNGSSNVNNQYGSKGGASGSKERPRHGKNAPTSNGGDVQVNAPSGQVKNFNPTSNAKKERTRLHKCIFCSGEHWSDECDQVRTIEDRLKLVADRCQKCFRSAHAGSTCEKWTQCAHCKETTHNRAICPKTFGTVNKILLAKAEVSTKSKSDCTLFITAMFPIGNTASSQRKTARAVLDTAGSRSLITNDLATQLGIANSNANKVRLTGVQGATLAHNAQAANLFLFPPKSEPIPIEVLIVPEIVDNVHSISVEQVKQRHPECEELEMPPEGNGSKVQLLLGYPALAKIVTLQKSKQIENLQLMSTKFGWIPFGEANEENNENENLPICLLKEADPVKLMCDLQQIGLAEFLRSENEEEELTLEKFYKTISKVGKHYQIEWPYRYDPPDLDDNFGLAMGRLLSLYKQLAPTPEMLVAYDQIIREQLETDVIEVVNTRRKLPRGRIHYLPHRGIIRIGKSTPIRMVFDASAKNKKGAKSLNDNIYKGGNWVTDIPSILIRFRRYNIALTSDVQKAFHQILIAPKDRDVTRFMWLRNVKKPPTSDNIIVYRFKRMAFGIVASPFLLTATIKYHLRENLSEYAEQIEDDMYADNLVTSLPNTIEPIHFYNSIKNTFNGMGMNITQWCTESEDLRRSFNPEDRILERHQIVLGLPWDLQTRNLSIKHPNLVTQKENVITKRIALQEMAKVFDPLGWSIPVVLMARIFLRKIWLLNYSWDEPLPENLAETWRTIRQNLKQVEKVQLPRAYALTGIEEKDELQLHAFCDASAEAYGVVIYLLIKNAARIWTGIIAAKSKLSPKTQLSIPRLELLAALVGTRYLLYVEKSLKVQNNITKYLWGDSRCVIAWTTSNKLLPPFIHKAVTEIRAAKCESFFYVPTNQNPADVVSRGADLASLQQQNWWNGPAWLENENDWPKQQKICDTESNYIEKSIVEFEEEEKILLTKSVELKHPVEPTSTKNSPFELKPTDFHTIQELLRRTSYCLKASYRFLRGRGNLRLQNDLDYNQARIIWFKWDQQRTYKPTNKEKSNVTYLQNLKIKVDEEGIIRCLTRLKWAKTPTTEAEPILLAKGTDLTQLLVLSIHKMNLHAGTAHTLATIRKKYWLPHGRRQVYQILKNNCYTCRRYETQPYRSPEMAPIPHYRINRTETPFKNVGVDVFGPFKTKINVNGTILMKKRWVIIFTCLVIRGIHLEILRDMTADEFLRTLRRFVGRRGTPRIIVSDNAPQFKAVEGIFQCMWRRFASSNITTKYYAEHEIEWRFIPAHAPWMGGAYERMIRTVKDSFERVYGGKTLLEDQFELAMVEIEAMVNSRPITYLDRNNETEIITPNDFLCLKYPALPVDFEKAPEAGQLAAAWTAGQKSLEEFWQLWSERYLREIRERRENMKNPRKSNPQQPVPGDLVLMVDPDQKRSSWRSAVIERVIKSADGEVRSAQIRTANRARMLRPITKLAPLKLLMALPENLPELTADQQGLIVDTQPGTVEL